MRGFLLRLLLNTLALWLVAQLYGGVYFAPGSGLGDYLLAGLIFGIANAIVRPILLLLTLPINLLSLGLFTLVINAVILILVSFFTSLEVRGFGGAFIGAIVLSIIGFVLNLLFEPRRR
ncbi:phage holin family protein [Meiothermus granaticius]|uniref:Mycobacterial 4 TMS phage holin, superfamily IV n=1 Tax=Meiothermus granaticius NBRC 107808 TaxID=1227551 RepID=A0A399FAN2_9DEIN|nr:phage holin family protein [Meiothermus granaticius]MCL6526706.1 phage holin family protein [Thermaceae bacterium]RIH93190.1 Mycobacterial 4 TMS phage holin, superfamily IV [Meiothermus granaticius NBRC 107808]